MKTHIRPAPASLLRVLGFVLLSACGSLGSSIGVVSPNVVANRIGSGTVAITVEGAVEENWCTTSSGEIRRFCFNGGRSANERALAELLASQGYTVVSGPADYSATLSFRDLENSFGTTMYQAVMSVAWQYRLVDSAGQNVVGVAERTTSPRPATGRGDVDACARSMFEAILERVAAESVTAAEASASATPTSDPVEPAADSASNPQP